MAASQSSLPLILAGPILRRVEPSRVCLWLVTTQTLDVRVTLESEGESAQKIRLLEPSDQFRQLKLGDSLYFLFIDLKLKRPLPQDQWVDYEFAVRRKGGKWQNLLALTPDLKYAEKKGLGFVLPSRISSLLHGSCRKPHHSSGDGLVEADGLMEKLIAEDGQSNENNPAWPSLLVLSGDQIYADDVAGPMLHAIHGVIEALDLTREDFSGLEVPEITNSKALYAHRNSYYRRPETLPKVEETRPLLDMLFGGVRKPIFTTDTANNHLISLHEMLVMYLMVWSPTPWVLASMKAPPSLTPEEQALYGEEKKVVEHFVEGLPRVRRLLAHLPVAMIFDDHDVTDDWNLNREWEQAVYGHPFSKRMIGNSLTAYLLCQAWGNHPDGFSPNLFEQVETFLLAPGGANQDEFISEILRFEGWEYDWPTEPPLIVMDSRTRRWRSESSLVKPSGLLDWEALVELQQKLSGLPNVLLVSPAPIFGVKLIETIQRLFTWLGKPLVVDAENWMAHPGTANSILNIFLHSKTPQTFVILSGDVHYSFAYDVELRNRKGGPDIFQITSSGLRNEFPKKLLDVLDVINRWLYSPRSPLNWFTKRRLMKVVPRKPEGHADGRRLLNAAGIGLVELDEQGRPWRIRQLVADGKPVEFHRMERHSRWQ